MPNKDVWKWLTADLMVPPIIGGAITTIYNWVIYNNSIFMPYTNSIFMPSISLLSSLVLSGTWFATGFLIVFASDVIYFQLKGGGR